MCIRDSNVGHQEVRRRRYNDCDLWYFYATRCYPKTDSRQVYDEAGHQVLAALKQVQQSTRPPVVIMGSALWDISRMSNPDPHQTYTHAIKAVQEYADLLKKLTLAVRSLSLIHI
eukprot:TRINITY_DN23410_c0_g1_i1.p1 TRINITY_DN23410_c0_g1~~TRINITY_DN23410_c0_g1_i1.p1  ORF type:complete len:115 (-),score=37.66 TRINITY_DN23410_c0_g1_i1:177-521(-)